MEQFQISDVVRLKSGGPAMTVTNVGNHAETDEKAGVGSENGVACVWFDGNKKYEDVFNAAVLEKIKGFKLRLAINRIARTKVIGLVIGWVIGVVVLFGFVWIFQTVFHGQMEEPPPPFLESMARPKHDTIDEILKKLEFGNVAFNAPKTMNLRDTAVIHLMLGLKTPTDELKQMIEAEGEKEGARIRVFDRMEARLSGSDFAITAITPEIQAVSRSDITEWKWKVKPSSEGHHDLSLILSVLLSVNDDSTPRAIRTFSKVIEVEVAWHQRVGLFFEKNWQWLWATLLVPIVGWLWKRKKGSKPDVSQSDS